MNWTGGRLQRHSKNAGGGVASRQKQHFAKIRSQLQNGLHPGQLPFRPSFFPDDGASLGSRLPPFTDRTSRHVGHSRKHKRRAHRNLASVDRDIVEAEHSNTNVSQSASHVSNAVDGDSAEKGKMKMKRRSAHTLLEDDRLEASRKRLLERRDWLGLQSSRPVHMKFRTRAEKDKIGKRRMIVGASSRGHAPKDTRNPMLPAQGLRDGHSRLDLAPAHDLLEDHLRVRIGTNAFFSQRSSTLVRDPPRRESSDTMLFDTAVDADTTLAVEGSRERSYEQHWSAGTSYDGEHETALEYENRQSANDLVGSLHAQREEAEGNLPEPGGIDEKLTSYLPHEPALKGRVIFQSVAPASSGSDQPASHVPIDTNNCPSEAAAPDGLEGGVSQEIDADDQDPQERKIVDETPWKQFLEISGDEQSHSSTSGVSERACLHGSEASIRGHNDAEGNSVADMTASRRAPRDSQEDAATWVIARHINGKTIQEYTTFERRARALVDDVKENENRQWQDFVIGSRGSSASDSAHDTIMGDKQHSPVHSARGTSMRALCSPKVQATSTSSISAPSRSAASPRLRRIQAGWGQSEEARLRPADLASSSLYNNISFTMDSPVAAAYSNGGPTNYANSDVSMAESGSAYEKMESD
ncbi:uncharacterized protein BDZ99DRAFT_5323 [Mytilinidion resinicola]|uniref:Uncharacterized protein n=1 Tax=Mytilinidion resinicola TaxID=574789 RepID=A0A6A6Z9J8_9PEZI|nr:uncharacterized protein BDZ99DRAFT_5323 [Mytilinidion resinicola]KAF2816955.1 hypothetical protein BDZ99DRAFT_5323 [Mytilinidion resinicola]